MRSWIVRLCRSTDGVRAEAKLLLAGLAHHHQQAAFPGTDSKVAIALGFSRETAAKLIAELAHAKLLVNEPVMTGQRGRPAVWYRVHPDVWATRLSAAAGSGSGNHRDEGGHFETVIQHLLQEQMAWSGSRPKEQREPPSRKGAASRLSPSNRFLLMTLLAVADRNGVVREWGPAALSRLAGLTPGRLEGQVQKLLALGYLRAVVPGVSGRSLFGKRPGALFLNLSHPAYKGLIGEILLVYPVRDVDHDYRNQGDARVIYKQIQHWRRQQPSGFVKGLVLNAGNPNPLSAIQQLAIYFDGVGTSTLAEYFQMRLEAYATQLLSDNLRPGDDIAAGHLGEVIAQEAFRREFRLLDESKEMYVRLVLHLAGRLATSLGRAVSQVNRLVSPYEDTIDLRDFTYALIPAIPSSGQGHFVLSAVPVSVGKGRPRCYVSGEEPASGRLRGSRVLSDEEAYVMGLLTRPTQRPANPNPNPNPNPLSVRQHLLELVHMRSDEDIS